MTNKRVETATPTSLIKSEKRAVCIGLSYYNRYNIPCF